MSIKKNLFQKVYIDPPRRGNGAYWTLLNEGIEEVERCMKLFTTLRPPVIDRSSVYCLDSSPSQQIVRSRGQFIPALDQDDHLPTSLIIKEEIEDVDDEEDSLGLLHNEALTTEFPILPAHSKHLRHPLEYYQEHPKMYPPSIQPFNGPARSSTTGLSSFNLHSNDHSNSSFPDLSFLTPLKSDFFNDGFGLSPLSNAPQNKQYFQHHGTSYSPLCTPLKPFVQQHEGGGDSGVFSPSNLQFCTPLKDLGEILQLNPARDAPDLYNQFETVPYSNQLSAGKSLLCSLEANAQF